MAFSNNQFSPLDDAINYGTWNHTSDHLAESDIDAASQRDEVIAQDGDACDVKALSATEKRFVYLMMTKWTRKTNYMLAFSTEKLTDGPVNFRSFDSVLSADSKNRFFNGGDDEDADRIFTFSSDVDFGALKKYVEDNRL